MAKTIVQQLIDEELKLVTEVNHRYKRFLKLVKKESDKLGGFEVIKRNTANLERFKAKLPSLMRRSGLNELAFPVNRQLKDIENIALIQLSNDLKKQLTAVDVRNMRQVTIDGVVKQNRIVFADQEKSFRKNLTLKNMKQVTSKTSFDRFMKQLTKDSQAKMHTIVRTTVQVHDNLTVTTKAESLGLKKFRYAGANDSKNRPFCASRVGLVFTDEEASKWDNEQLENAEVTLGGYNCRHRKRYIVE